MIEIKTKPKKTTKKDFVFAVGRCKAAVARVRLSRGKGKITVNGKTIEEYFPGEVAKTFWQKPFQVTQTEGKYDASVKVEGSGWSGQLKAVTHGLARALNKENEKTYRTALKKNKLLTRDARVKERRKVGQGGKARRKKQSPKR
ncbi:30S ribosomal protein S9 [Candidatus Shapirobacteria bacterium]|nr:30S ribosomal protein S9 [Candidatus Shapirobacteria bacterium]